MKPMRGRDSISIAGSGIRNLLGFRIHNQVQLLASRRKREQNDKRKSRNDDENDE
jgi:hypothetical protein